VDEWSPDYRPDDKSQLVNILILIDTMRFGGAEKQALLDANALVMKGNKVILACFHTGDLIRELDGSVQVEVISKKSYPGRILDLVRIIKKNRVDLIFAHMIIAEVVAAAAGSLTGRYVVLNEHGLGVNRRMAHRLGIFAASRLADSVWCASDATRRVRIERERVPEHKTRVVYNCFTPFSEIDNNNGVDVGLAGILSRDAGARPVIAGFVGRFDPVKRLDLLVEAAARIPDENILFVLVGDGMEMDRMRSLISEQGLDSRFCLTGFIHNPGRYYELFDIFVLPSVRESLSMSLLEAGSNRLPALAFDVGGNSEVIKHGETGLLAADGDMDGFVNNLRTLVSDGGMRVRMGESARKFVTDTFAGDVRISALLDVCDKVGEGST
jgi:glycosyltransferase involved in cell wall biosynthesis